MAVVKEVINQDNKRVYKIKIEGDPPENTHLIASTEKCLAPVNSYTRNFAPSMVNFSIMNAGKAVGRARDFFGIPIVVSIGTWYSFIDLHNMI